jgi:hypothetical protein
MNYIIIKNMKNYSLEIKEFINHIDAAKYFYQVANDMGYKYDNFVSGGDGHDYQIRLLSDKDYPFDINQLVNTLSYYAIENTGVTMCDDNGIIYNSTKRMIESKKEEFIKWFGDEILSLKHYNYRNAKYSLNDIYKGYQNIEGHGDKGTIHTYIDEYEVLLNPYRYNSDVLEVGICKGESVRMWDDYFVDSTIIGVDIEVSGLVDIINAKYYNIIIADATKPSFLDKINNHKFDVIIDDGSHRLEDQIKTFFLLKDSVKAGGIYIIEDIQDIESSRVIFEGIHPDVRIIDNRFIKNRYDDVMVVYTF